jgi:hypothetical protein
MDRSGKSKRAGGTGFRVFRDAGKRVPVTQPVSEELKLVGSSADLRDWIFAGPTALFIQKNLRKSV